MEEQILFENKMNVIENMSEFLEMGFSEQDLIEINKRGVSLETVKNQLEIFENGVSKTVLDRPAKIDDGILALSNEKERHYADVFEQKRNGIKLEKFVPASGAASRMFAFLSEFINEFKTGDETVNAYINRKNAFPLSVFLVGIEKFPFYKNVNSYLQEIFPFYEAMDSDLSVYHFIKVLLSQNHFNFINKPKGVLPFHKYGNQAISAMEEQLNESIFLANADGKSLLHFTISEEHRPDFEEIAKDAKNRIESRENIQLDIQFSYQKKTTDSIAVDLENKPFRNDKGELVFRPAGHGALIENLNDLDSDVIFIKNIDNVIHSQTETIAHYKNVLGGVLLELQEKIFGFLQLMDNGNFAESQIDEMVDFAQEKLHLKFSEDFGNQTIENKLSQLKQIFDRPIRVCGMVKNEGEPGGGPFWVLDESGNVSLQIVESAQVDVNDKRQNKILKKATHFNPVDLVCGIKNHKGEKFDLRKYVDPNSGFIVKKTNNGRALKSYELPGLWNGAMANWITLFVEVPLITFNPVKTVNDLLKPAHQPQ